MQAQIQNGMSEFYNSSVEALSLAILANQSVILWGPPGVGKTSVLNSIAKRYNMHIETVMANIREPADFNGYPVVREEELIFAPPSWAKNVIRKHKSTNGKPSMVFYDEVSTARPDVQAALLRPTLEKVVGDVQMPENTITVAAANHPDEAASGWDLSAPNANRFMHVDWKLTAKDIERGFVRGWPDVTLPRLNRAGLEKKIRQAMILVGSFVGAHPSYAEGKLQLGSTTSPHASMYAFATPRSWESVARFYGYAKSIRFVLDPDSNDRSEGNLIPISSEGMRKGITGLVGEDAGHEFLEYTKHLDLPDPQALLNDPSSFVVPKRLDILNTVLNSIEMRAKEEKPLDKKTWLNWGDILVAVLDAKYADFAYASAKEWIGLREKDFMPSQEQSNKFAQLFARLDG